VLTDGTTLRTLRDAISYLGKSVPKSDHTHPVIVTAATVTQAAEGKDFIMHASIATLKAIHRRKNGCSIQTAKKSIGASGS
jgi:hypothetical protein